MGGSRPLGIKASDTRSSTPSIDPFIKTCLRTFLAFKIAPSSFGRSATVLLLAAAFTSASYALSTSSRFLPAAILGTSASPNALPPPPSPPSPPPPLTPPPPQLPATAAAADSALTSADFSAPLPQGRRAMAASRAEAASAAATCA